MTTAGGQSAPIIDFCTFGSRTDTTPRAVRLPWTELAKRLTRHEERSEKGGALWSAVVYRQGTPQETTRDNKNVDLVTAMSADLDHDVQTHWEEHKRAIDPFTYAVHSTHRHTLDNMRCRVVLPFAKPVKAADWPRTWDNVNHALFDGALDPSTKDQARMYYWPTCPPGELRFAFAHDGAFLDPDTLPPAPDAETRRAKSSRGPSRPVDLIIDTGLAAKALTLLSPERADTYNTWLCVGMALWWLGDAGFGLWDAWSKRFAKYKDGDCERKWKSFKDDPNGIKLGSLFRWAEDDSGINVAAAGPVTSTRTSETDEPWDAPTPFFPADGPPFPVDCLPGWQGAFVRDEAEATQTPPDLAGMMALSAEAVAVQKKVKIEIERGWREPANNFTATMLGPGNRKTAVVKDAVQPIEDFERSEIERLSVDVFRAEAETKQKKARVEHLQNQAARAKDETEAANLRDEATQLAVAISVAQIPALPRYLVDDVTPEKTASMLAAHGGKIAVLSAEADLFDLMTGRYGNAPNFGVYLRGHAGDTLRVDRVGRPSEFVKEPAITLGLAVQPDAARGLVKESSLRGRGLLARFWYSWPRSLLGERDVDAAPVPDDVADAYAVGLTRLLRMPAAVNEQGEDVPHIVTLSREAAQTFRKFRLWIEPQLADGGEFAAIQDWAAKCPGAVARIALLIHLAKRADLDQPWAELVDAATMESAIRLGHYLIAHARVTFAAMGADPAITDATYILEWIERTETKSFTRRDALRGCRRFKTVDELEQPLALLIDHGYIRERETPGTGSPGRPKGQTYDVNPNIVLSVTCPGKMDTVTHAPNPLIPDEALNQSITNSSGRHSTVEKSRPPQPRTRDEKDNIQTPKAADAPIESREFVNAWGGPVDGQTEPISALEGGEI